MITGKDVYEAACPFIVKCGFEDLAWEGFVPEAQAFYVELASQLNKIYFIPLQGLVQDLVDGLQDCWDNVYSLDDLNDLKGRAQTFLQGNEPAPLGTMPFEAGVAMAGAITAQGEKVKALKELVKDLVALLDDDEIIIEDNPDGWYVKKGAAFASARFLLGEDIP